MTSLPHVLLLALVLLTTGASYARAADFCASAANITVSELKLTPPGQSPGEGSSLNTWTQATPSGGCQTWKLTKTTLLSPDSDCVGADRWLLLELYVLRRVRGTGLVLDAQQTGTPGRIAFMASRDFMPSIQFVPGTNQFVPLPSIHDRGTDAWRTDKTGNGGLFIDDDATWYDRSHHRLLIPNVTNTPRQNDVWYVTVSNLDDMAATLDGYSIRATCLPAAKVPCARPFPSLGSCSLPTTASQQDEAQTCMQRVAGDPTTSYCSCNATAGDYGCNRPVTTLSSSGRGVQVTVPSNSFALFKVQVPTNPPNPTSNVLLAEFTRDGSSSMGADPLLLVKPVNTGDRNTPYWVDASSWADNSDWALLQSYHYVLTRNIKASNSEWYIAVGNYWQRFRSDTTLRGSLVVRWGTPQQQFMCPKDCSGVGTCQDPGTTPNMPSYGLGDGSSGFICKCPSGYGGLYCDGSMQSVTLGTSPQSISGVLAPGQWSFLEVSIDQRKFNYKTDSMVVNWRSRDSLGTPAGGQLNAIFTLNEDQFPQQGQYVPPGGNNYYLVASYPSAVGKLPFELQGNRMRQGATYLLGVYNSEYQRSVPANFYVEVVMPVSSASWLHPYMSVVLGITAAIVLCLCMTLCKRVVMRNRWGPWAHAHGEGAIGVGTSRQLGELDANGLPRHAMLQIVPRHRGVPASVVDSFPTFSYVSKGLASSSNPSICKGSGPLPDDAHLHSVTCQAHATHHHQHHAPPPDATRTHREALQAAAAEAATTAAAAVMAIAQQQQQQDGAAAAAAAGAEGVAGGGDGAHNTSSAAMAQQQQQQQQQQQGEAQMAAMAAAAAKAAAAAHHRREPSAGDTAAGALQTQGGSDAAAHVAHLPLGGGEGSLPLVAAPVEDAKLPPLPDEDAPACTVCLCEYEEGDGMRRLPCGHEFHRQCIDKWMTQHVTCPICREPLVSPEQLAEMQQQQQQQQQVGQGAGGAAAGGSGTHVAVIYIPQSLRRQIAANSGSGTVNGSPGAVAAASAAERGVGLFRSLSRAFSSSAARRANSSAAAGAGLAPQQSLQLVGAGGGGGSARGVPAMAGGGSTLGLAEAGAAGWHTTMAWGSTDPGGDPFATPLPMRASIGGGARSAPAHSSSSRRQREQQQRGSGGSRGAGRGAAVAESASSESGASSSARVAPAAGGAGGAAEP